MSMYMHDLQMSTENSIKYFILYVFLSFFLSFFLSIHDMVDFFLLFYTDTYSLLCKVATSDLLQCLLRSSCI